MNPRKTLELILQGSRNIRFGDLIGLVEAYGFKFSRQNGSHHIYSRPGIPEAINLQDYQGQAKSYQIRQLLKLVEKYGFKLEDRI